MTPSLQFKTFNSSAMFVGRTPTTLINLADKRHVSDTLKDTCWSHRSFLRVLESFHYRLVKT